MKKNRNMKILFLCKGGVWPTQNMAMLVKWRAYMRGAFRRRERSHQRSMQPCGPTGHNPISEKNPDGAARPGAAARRAGAPTLFEP